jgi:hypothetical protein
MNLNNVANQNRVIREVHMREVIENFISSSEPVVLKKLGVLMLDKVWSLRSLEDDLGTEAIELLINETKHMDYHKLNDIYSHLKDQKVIK